MNTIQEIGRTPEGKAAMARVLEEFGMTDNDSNRQQLQVFLEAVAIHEERSTHYRDHWQEQGALDNLRNARGKVRRQVAVISNVAAEEAVLDSTHLDDAIDGINYLAFAVRNLRALNFDGWE